MISVKSGCVRSTESASKLFKCIRWTRNLAAMLWKKSNHCKQKQCHIEPFRWFRYFRRISSPYWTWPKLRRLTICQHHHSPCSKSHRILPSCCSPPNLFWNWSLSRVTHNNIRTQHKRIIHFPSAGTNVREMFDGVSLLSVYFFFRVFGDCPNFHSLVSVSLRPVYRTDVSNFRWKKIINRISHAIAFTELAKFYSHTKIHTHTSGIFKLTSVELLRVDFSKINKQP